jgi:hypothetical protein
LVKVFAPGLKNDEFSLAHIYRHLIIIAQYLTPRADRFPSTCSSGMSGLARDVEAWTKTCLHCQQSKIQHHTRTMTLHIPIL